MPCITLIKGARRAIPRILNIQILLRATIEQVKSLQAELAAEEMTKGGGGERGTVNES